MTGSDNTHRSLPTEGNMLGMRYRLFTVVKEDGDCMVLEKSSFLRVNDFLGAVQMMKKRNDRFHHFEILCSHSLSDVEKEQWLGIDLSSASTVPMELHHLYVVDNLPDSIKAQFGLQARGEDTYPVTVVGGFDWFLIPCALELYGETKVECTMLELRARYLDDTVIGQRLRTLGARLHQPRINGSAVSDIDLRSLSYVDAIIDDHSDFWLTHDMADPKAPYLEPLAMMLRSKIKEETK